MYRERPSRVPGAVLWERRGTVDPDALVLPDGCMDLLWSDGELLIAGPDTRAFQAARPAVAHYAAIRFASGDAPAFFGLPANEVRDRRVPLAEVWSAPVVRRLAERVTESPDPATALEDFALEHLRRTEPPDPVHAAIASRLGSGASVADTAEAVNLGERQLLRRCRAAFGYGPKTLARILRFNRALDLVRAGEPYAIAAARSGYADQAHLSREVRDLAGVPLGTLLGR